MIIENLFMTFTAIAEPFVSEKVFIINDIELIGNEIELNYSQWCN